jgi:hypothetical protein
MQKLCVSDASQLDSINGLIHDEHFDLNDIKYDKEKHYIEIPFRRIFHYHSPPHIIKRRLIYKIGEVDVLRCILRIDNVQKYEAIDKSQIGTYSFNVVQYNPDSKVMKFECNENCDLNITISDIAIEYNEIEYRGKARITYGWFWENNDSKVYE